MGDEDLQRSWEELLAQPDADAWARHHAITDWVAADPDRALAPILDSLERQPDRDLLGGYESLFHAYGGGLHTRLTAASK